MLDLPDDVLRVILGMCPTSRTVVSVGCTCRRMRDLVEDMDTLPPMTLTCVQDKSAHAWARSPHIARKFHTLTARRCVFSTAPWVSKFSALTTLVMTFCRVGVEVLGKLPPSLVHLNIHTLVPRHGYESGRASFQRLTRLRTLAMTFDPARWNVAFVAKLPRGLRECRLRGAKAMVVESHMPKGLRCFHAAADTMLLLCNRLPNRVEDVCLTCDSATSWLRDIMPMRPHRLRSLSLRFRAVGTVPRLAGMKRLQSLALWSTTLSVNWSALAALPALTRVSLGAAHWLVTTHSSWPSSKPVPAIRATVGDVEASDLVAPAVASGSGRLSPPHKAGSQHGHSLGTKT